MKRYFVFATEQYYPGGGMHDFCGDADSYDEALAKVEGFARVERQFESLTYQILDSKTGVCHWLVKSDEPSETVEVFSVDNMSEKQ